MPGLVPGIRVLAALDLEFVGKGPTDVCDEAFRHRAKLTKVEPGLVEAEPFVRAA
jgi:hypothetical protein